jgi:seryl-tRNA synthetase
MSSEIKKRTTSPSGSASGEAMRSLQEQQHKKREIQMSRFEKYSELLVKRHKLLKELEEVRQRIKESEKSNPWLKKVANSIDEASRLDLVKRAQTEKKKTKRAKKSEKAQKQDTPESLASTKTAIENIEIGD